jgi:hypothetical protein
VPRVQIAAPTLLGCREQIAAPTLLGCREQIAAPTLATVTRPTTLLTAAWLFAVTATALGLVVSNGSTSARVAATVLGLLIYGSLALFIRQRPRVVAVAVLILSALGAAANVMSPNAAQLLVMALSVVSAGLAVAALPVLPTRE